MAKKKKKKADPTLRCLCGFDGWTLLPDRIECIRCDTTYRKPDDLPKFNDRPEDWRIQQGQRLPEWPPDPKTA